MKFKIKILASLLLFSGFASEMSAGTVVPNVKIASVTSSVSGMPAVNTVNASGLSEAAVTATHDNSADGSTMWSSNYIYSDISIMFDLLQSYNINDLYIWNFNREGNTDCGFKNVKIEYSIDRTTWTELKPAGNPGYTVNAAYPFQLAQASGENGIAATNLNDGKNTPVHIGAKARYVRIKSAQIGGKNEGNWGGKSSGLSEVMFTTDDAAPDGYKVEVNASEVVNTCGHLLFGGCHSPSFAQMGEMLPQFIDAGMNTIRMDFELQNVVPNLSSVDDYYNNVGGCQNPDNWDYSPFERAVLAKKAGMTTMMIISYCPAWLSYNGQISGIPKDMAVYTDILRKVYSRYYKYIDYVEFYNEPGYFVSLDNSPYSSVGKALADMYVPCYEVIQSITPGKPMGGLSVVTWSDGGVGGRTNRDFFGDERITTENFNFYSHHVYSDYGIETSKETVTRVKKELSKFGFGDLPVWFTEWSSSINNPADSVTYTGSKSHTFVGKCLVNWMRDGLTGAHHWNYMRAIALKGTEPGENADGHGMYAWNAVSKTGYLLPKAYVFKLLSRTLGFGKDENKVLDVINSASDKVNIGAFTNADGTTSVVAVNEGAEPVRVDVRLEGLEGVSDVEAYVVTYYVKGEEPTHPEFTTGKLTRVVFDLPASSVTGLKFVK